MIQEFVNIFDAKRNVLTEKYSKTHPDSYAGIVKDVIALLGEDDDYGVPDVERIHVIDDGDYQGTMLFVIGAKGYQPSTYWAVPIGYGSCSGCDTFEAIKDYSGNPPSEGQAKDYVNLALHVIQGLRKITGWDMGE